eukprot:TRINITY_DN21485_c0_g1_i5.p1 TRINITY_DN21485_c0_g1~~TRINITY_DN21485_c0_g1_i5.p1  ORF type:complete len:175 (-),score=36.14 TRINITY_DN21485_c0_g1_i5:225-749(-)
MSKAKRARTDDSPTAVWMDCDPGHDDAIALLLVANHPQLKLLGVSACSGNQSVDKTWRNAVNLLAIAGLPDVPVYRGQAAPILRHAKHDPGIHGESGLDGSPTFDSFKREKDIPEEWKSKKAVFAMGEHIAACEGKVTIVATGALTNVALFLTMYPELKSKMLSSPLRAWLHGS